MLSLKLMGVHLSGIIHNVPTYIPEFHDGKKVISSCINVTILEKHNGRRQPLKLIAWGKLADSMAKHCATGIHIDCLASPQSYSGYLFDKDGNHVIDRNGYPIAVSKVSFTVSNIIFGGNGKHKSLLIGELPEYWMVDGHYHNELWRAQCALADMKRLDDNAVKYDGKSEYFGYAKIVKRK